MEFIYKYAALPEDQELITHMNASAGRLYRKLKDTDIYSLDISEYNKRYLNERLHNLHRTLQMYSYILLWSVANTRLPVNAIVLCDYGGGSGIMSLLAKEIGIGTVIYNDIYDVSCRDAKILGESTGNAAEYYVEGDIDEVLGFLRKNSIHLNAFVSCDVIEHVYDIEGFFRKLYGLSEGPLSVVMSSHANNCNPLIRKILMKKQVDLENKDREKKWGHKERDSLKAYFNARKEMILERNSDLTENEVVLLARATRGMMRPDIDKCVDEYLKTGRKPEMPGHRTNTCDPFTGNWAEHLMPPGQFKDILSRTGFEAEILKGFYGRWDNPFMRSAAFLMDIMIYVTKGQGIRFAPFFLLLGKKY